MWAKVLPIMIPKKDFQIMSTALKERIYNADSAYVKYCLKKK